MLANPQAMGVQSAHATLVGFLDEIKTSGLPLNAVTLFHAVRNMPYLSTGDRSLDGILQRRAGSCSSKHILLGALLNEIGITARVELVLGDFATPFRHAHNIPAALIEASSNGIRDIHNILRADIDGTSVILDATWHDAMSPFHMRVNTAWNGQGDTEIAVDVQKMLGPSTEPAADKALIIASWPHAEQQARRRFLETVNDWVASIKYKNGR